MAARPFPPRGCKLSAGLTRRRGQPLRVEGNSHQELGPDARPSQRCPRLRLRRRSLGRRAFVPLERQLGGRPDVLPLEPSTHRRSRALSGYSERTYRGQRRCRWALAVDPTLVLDAGLTRRLRSGIGPDSSSNSRGFPTPFALRGLMPAGQRVLGDSCHVDPNILTRSLRPPLFSWLHGWSKQAVAQTQRDEQFYYPGDFNWQFLRQVSRGRAAVQRLRLRPRRAVRAPLHQARRATRALEKEYRYLTTDLLSGRPASP